MLTRGFAILGQTYKIIGHRHRMGLLIDMFSITGWQAFISRVSTPCRATYWIPPKKSADLIILGDIPCNCEGFQREVFAETICNQSDGWVNVEGCYSVLCFCGGEAKSALLKYPLF